MPSTGVVLLRAFRCFCHDAVTRLSQSLTTVPVDCDCPKKLRERPIFRMFRAIDRSALGRGPHALGASRNQVLARDLAGPAPTIEESWTGGAVLDLCAAHPAIPSFAVVEGKGRVIGLIERERLYFQFSQPLWFDVYNRRPIAPLVSREAMVVDGAMPIEGVKELIAYRYPPAISSGFAIVDEERYLGIGTMTALLEKTVDLGHRRAVELEEAHRKAESASEAKSRFLAKSEVRSQKSEVRSQESEACPGVGLATLSALVPI